MGFHIEINSILRSDEPYQLVRGQTYDFRKTGSRVFFDTLPIWLTRSDWTPLAEILVMTQTRTPTAIIGQFKVQHLYAAPEQAVLTEILRRMYAPEGDPNIYVLLSGANYQKSLATGVYEPETLPADGFIHASPAAQLTRVANKHYQTVADVHLLVAAIDKIKPVVKWEPATGGLYPHIYGPLNMDAVVKVHAIRPDAAGVFLIKPEDVVLK